LIAHDLLLLGSAREVFITYARRVEGSPTARSRFLERLYALLDVHQLSRGAIDGSQYVSMARALDHAAEYRPEAPAMPMPTAADRPAVMKVSALDHLFDDPYYLYARYVLGLRERDPFDALPEAKDRHDCPSCD